jgi:hypothetical protein
VTDIVVLIVFVITCAVLIEFRPRRLELVLHFAVLITALSAGISWLPDWYGWLALLLTSIYMFWLYRAIQRDETTVEELRRLFVWAGQAREWLGVRLAEFFRWTKTCAKMISSRRKTDHDQRPESASDSPRHPVRVSVVLALSGIATAIPASLFAALILITLDTMTGDSTTTLGGGSESVRYLLGVTFVIWVSGLQVAIDQFVVSLPVIGLLAYTAAVLAARVDRRWIYYLGSALLLGAVYPVFYTIASVTGQLGGPIFN